MCVFTCDPSSLPFLYTEFALWAACIFHAELLLLKVGEFLPSKIFLSHTHTPAIFPLFPSLYAERLFFGKTVGAS